MITLKELNYVGTSASKVPYPGIQYAQKTSECLIEAVEEYKKNYKDKQYDIILSDGNEFTFEIMSKNLCHMLGVDYRNLSSEFFCDFRNSVLNLNSNVVSSYELLNAIIEHIDDVLKYDYENGNKILNYYRLMIKCNIFQKLSDFTQFNFGVINFDKNTFKYNTGNNYFGNTEKLLYVQSNEKNCPYFMMGILKDGNNGNNDDLDESNYVVETLLAPYNVGEFFRGQKVAIPTQIMIIDDLMNKYVATPREKIALINQYKSIILEYGLENNLDIYGDYINMLSTQDNLTLSHK